MICPKCNQELSEDTKLCPNCNEISATAEPLETEIETPGNPLTVRKSYAAGIAKWLKVGGIIYIVIGSANDIVNFVSQLAAVRSQNQTITAGIIGLYALSLCYTLLDTLLWGLFFVGLGKIIEILKAGFKHEN